MSARALCLVGSFAAFTAAAQEAAPTLYAPPAYGIQTARQISLGGAYVAVAEEGAFTANHASFAQPSRWLGNNFDTFGTFQLATTVGDQDLDNDLRVDGAGVRQVLAGLGLRYRRFGFGLFIRTATVCAIGPCEVDDEGDAVLDQGGISVAYALFDGQLVSALGLHGTSARLTTQSEASWSGVGGGVDLLWRPRGWPVRVGLVYRSTSLAQREAFETQVLGTEPHATQRPSRVAFPGRLSVGLAAKLDRGGSDLNVPRDRDTDPTSPVAAESAFSEMFRSRRELPPGRLLASVQLDVTLPVQDAVALEHFTRVVEGGTPAVPPSVAPRIGGRPLFTPRLGLEHITVPGRLRLRAGTYLEPSATAGVPLRPHGTAGFDLFLFHFLVDWGLTGALDVAPRLRQGTLSFGLWG